MPLEAGGLERVARLFPITPQAFEQAFDEIFDEIMGRWQTAPQTTESSGELVVDHGDHYEVRISAPGADPRQIEVQVSDSQLIVRAPTVSGQLVERAISFAESIEREKVTSRWADQVLITILPKRPRHGQTLRVKVE